MPDSPIQLRPFTDRTPPEAIEDLRSRLRATRWPDAPEDAGWSLGTDLDYLRELVAYWADGFDWAAQEEALSLLPRFRTTVGGRGIHLVHAHAVGPTDSALPLLLCHGWPDSFWRYSKVVAQLVDPAAHGADPADAFDVVVPDMPGYGYSDRPTGAPLDSAAVAGLWAELMTGLGYRQFGAAGGDIGSAVSRSLGIDHADRTVAVHRIDAGLPQFTGDRSSLTEPERDYLQHADDWSATEGAYAHLHRTKPQTVAFGLTDSPVGMAAWIVEKLRSWSDCQGEVERSFSRDEILTNLSIYWFTATIGSAMRMYHANAGLPPEQRARRVEVPSGFALFPADITHPPRAWLERTSNLVRLTEMPSGGHFAPFEEPELYARELREFFRPFRLPRTG